LIVLSLFLKTYYSFKKIEKKPEDISEESDEDQGIDEPIVAKRSQKIRSNEKRNRPESSLIESSNIYKQSRNNDEEADEDYDGSDAELIGAEESMFAAFCQNTTIIHADFKRFASIQIKNSTELLSTQKTVSFLSFKNPFFKKKTFKKKLFFRWLK